MSIIVPGFAQWSNMSDEERLKIARTWNMRAGDGKALAIEVLKRFKKRYGHIPEVIVADELGIPVAGIWAINVHHKARFDRKKIPETFFGFEVRQYLFPGEI